MLTVAVHAPAVHGSGEIETMYVPAGTLPAVAPASNAPAVRAPVAIAVVAIVVEVDALRVAIAATPAQAKPSGHVVDDEADGPQ